MTTRAQPTSAGLFSTVVSNGFCIGCGVCAGLDDSIKMGLDSYGRYIATAREGLRQLPEVERLCPFADDSLDEDEIGRELFNGSEQHDSRVGYYLEAWCGWVVEADYRVRGSSGGLGSWLLSELLARRMVDAVVHVSPSIDPGCGDPLFRFKVSVTPNEINAGSKSRYYPVEMSGVIQSMLKRPGRYAVVGVPCFVKAIRLACRESSLLRQRVAFTVAIVCGHLKSAAFAEYLGWECGFAPGSLRAIDFRTKLPGRDASSYGVTATGETNGRLKTVTRPMLEIFGSNWGHGFFKYKACDFCDDVVGETADVSIGDAWLPEYVSDGAGTNVVVVRSPAIQGLLRDGAVAGRLHLDPVPIDKVVESQMGAFRHRRDGLAYRLFLEDDRGRWRPSKRVRSAAKGLSSRLIQVQRLRTEIAPASHQAFAAAKVQNDLGAFVAAMKPLTNWYDRLCRPSLLRRLAARSLRALGVILRSRQ